MAQKEYSFLRGKASSRQSSTSAKRRAWIILRTLLAGFVLVTVFNILFSRHFYTPKMYRLSARNKEILIKYRILNDKINEMSATLDQIKHRDNSVYRPLFGIDTIAIAGIYTPYPDSKYAPLQGCAYSALMTDIWQEMDEVARRLYLQSRSLDELQTLSADKVMMATALPAIMPINRKALHGDHIGAFGWRNHPIYHRYIYHKGIDLGSDRGTPVYSAGDGVVSYVNARGTGRRGYGKHIVIDHGFGYKTKYAHLHTVDVVEGQRVRRGEIIGQVGNTGGSTGPHLHYEVLYMGTPVNPINYFRRDMASEDFERIVESANTTTFETEFGTND